jgi:diaminopimelate dehydrogenase
LEKIRAGIYGYGNIAKGVEKAIAKSTDISLEAVFTRRDPAKVSIATKGVKVVAADKVHEYKDRIDVMILCSGSATDLPVQAPELVRTFNIVDSFDTHAKIPEYLDAVGWQAEKHKKAAVISVGWDPGLFSMMKSLFADILPDGKNQAFWGPGVSQGHSEAIRGVAGVADAIQYTVPSEDVMNEIRDGSVDDYTVRQKHKRLCYVVAEEGADRNEIAKAVKGMPYYFSDYDTEVNFISAGELRKEHGRMPHAGHVFRNGTTGEDGRNSLELSIKMDSNPEFTGSIMVAFARAAFRLYKEKNFGAKTGLDIPLSYLSPKDRKDLIAEML